MQNYSSDSAPNVLLYAEDNVSERQILSHRLIDEGWTVIGVEDGDRTIAEVERHRPPVIVLDIDLPGFDGWRALHYINSIPRYRPRVIALSAFGFLEYEARRQGLACEAFFAKPINYQTLADFVGYPL
ncbi:response regulator [Pararhodospirillum oryzae]|uniref:Response regulatory domain-containing protein n=1 Tax=Pararhodospirillum oryzae TaxID=478448 RepID=A0A512H8Z3_9PROT|nr:response regulator [Pararhodospirillum oryzae]GEO81924.1 hypothetical protein ROR02_20550 [Pararhodospirillum oryzae]